MSELQPAKTEAVLPTPSPQADLAPIHRAASLIRPYVEALVALGAGFALAGYLADRSHSNFLGLPGPSELEVDRYLMTAFAFARDVLIRALIYFIPGVVFSWLVARFFRWMHTSNRLTADKVAQRVAVTLNVVVSALQVVAVVAFFSWRDHFLSALGGPVALGPLRKLETYQAHQTELFYELLVAALVFTLGTAAHRTMTAERYPALRAWRALTLGVLLLFLPLAYGVAAMPNGFRSIKVTFKAEKDAPEPPPRCGLQLSSSAKDLVIWSVHHDNGTVLVLPREQAAAIEYGPEVQLLPKSTGQAERRDAFAKDPCQIFGGER